MRQIEFRAPVVRERSVSFFWSTHPPSDLYREERFTLLLPSGVDARRLPERLLWTAALIVLHGHWPLLAPCVVRLPVCLGETETALIERLAAALTITLEAERAAQRGVAPDWAAAEGGVRVEDGSRVLPAAEPLPDRGLCAAALSGGKDSLAQVGLLREMGLQPVCVITTSPMPPLYDHEGARRRQILAELERRTGLQVVEVRSDLRSLWANDAPDKLGYLASSNELVDTHLYLAAMLLAAYDRGITHLFLAAEAEVQETVEVGSLGGRIVQHRHLMYSAATQAVLSRLLQPFGIRYGSLITSLPTGSVTKLLWNSYPDLADLQTSCWRHERDEAACSACSKCLQATAGALAHGADPAVLGIDLDRLLAWIERWKPRGARLGALPTDRVGATNHAQILQSIAAAGPGEVRRALAGRRRDEAARIREAWERTRLRLAAKASPLPPSFRAAALADVDPGLRDRLRAILESRLARDDDPAHAATRERQRRLVEWIAQPRGMS